MSAPTKLCDHCGRWHLVAQPCRQLPQTPQLARKRRNYYRPRYASRAEQRARYIDCGPQAWDDRE
jgi:hypothetical protein